MQCDRLGKASGRWGAAAVAALALGVLSQASVAGRQGPTAGKPVSILDGSSVWRVLHSWDAVLVKTAEGIKERRLKSRRAGPADRPDFHFMSIYPPEGWTKSDFDDSHWARQHFFAKYVNGEIDSRAGGGAASPYLRQLTLRGKFTVTDPQRVRGLGLTMRYRGGVVVYLNGKELARQHMPAGPVRPGAPAEMYSPDVYLNPKGRPWGWWADRKAIREKSYPFRVRKIDWLAIPSRELSKGTNVLAIEIHAAPYPAPFASGKARCSWATCGLIELHLQAAKPDGLVPNVVRPKGLQVWNTNVLSPVYDLDWADPHERVGPLRLVGARNGCYTGRVVVSSDEPIRKLRAAISELSGPERAKIPASAVRVSYGVFDGIGAGRGSNILYGPYPVKRDDGMLDDPPEVVAVRKKQLSKYLMAERLADGLPATLRDGAVQPVYITVRVPKRVPAGLYKAVLTISAAGHEPVKVPVEVTVADWALPDPADFAYWCGLIQSPEGVALHYRVPLWSERHWQLVDRSLQWVGQVGSKVLFIPLGAESEYGNGRSMVTWIRRKDGSYDHDFSAVERYVQLAVKRLPKLRFVVVGVWQFVEFKGRPRITVRDEATGRVENIDGPTHGTAEALRFWKPVLLGVREILKTHGLEKAMLLGYISDRLPSKATVEVFHKILPEVGWQGQRHSPRGAEYLSHGGGRVPVMYQSNVWGCGDIQDPSVRRVYGWNYHYGVPGGLRTWLNRTVYDHHPLTAFRGMSENVLLSNRPGQGQLGADFWPPPVGKGRRRLVSLYSRFPRSRNVGAGNKGITANQLLYPGPDGAVPTVRFEMLREGIQECEARIFLEKLLAAKPCPLPAELARKCQVVLDERTRWQRVQSLATRCVLSWPCSGWERRTLKLYELAGQAAKAAGRK